MVESFASTEQIGALRKRIHHLLDKFDCSTASIFSTKNQVHSYISFNLFYNKIKGFDLPDYIPKKVRSSLFFFFL